MAPTCDKDGSVGFYATATFGGKEYKDQHLDVVPATGHNFQGGRCTVCGAADPSYNSSNRPNPGTGVSARGISLAVLLPVAAAVAAVCGAIKKRG